MNTPRPRRILVFGDFLPTGFGRITREVALHLHQAGYEVIGACVQWDGILPLPQPVPFHVCALNGRDHGQGPAGFAAVLAQIVQAAQPDVLLSVQDFPYHEALRHAPIDWSVLAHIVITPLDGVPVDTRWLRIAPEFDALLTISEFGVAAFKEQGIRADLCAPGVDPREFYRLPDTQRAALRDQLGLPRDAFVVGVMAMNQGRKDFPTMIAAFAEAFRDVPEAYLYLDCEPVSPVGWDIPNMLLAPNRLDPGRVRFRADAFKAGIGDLNTRYNLLDLHMVIAHREGYGLPHGEALATGCPTIAIDYCSGREIVGDDARGWLIPATPAHPGAFGTWGGALDYWADLPALEAALREAYDHPSERLARGARGVEWAHSERSWLRASAAVLSVVERVIAQRGPDLDAKYGQPGPPPPMLITEGGNDAAA